MSMSEPAVIGVTEEDAQQLAIQLGQALNASGKVLATAESCTGGWVAQVITSVPDSSTWFDRGFVTYSISAKRELLDVDAATLRDHGAVSEPTALAMARGALAHSQAQLAVAVTGLAGPGGGTPEKPVGTVCFAWAEREGPASATTAHFAGDRADVRRQSVVFALQGLLERARAPRH